MSTDEAKVLSLCLFVALKHASTSETEILLGEIHDKQEVVEAVGKAGFRRTETKAETTANVQDYAI